MKLTDRLWLPFLYELKSYVVVSSIIFFCICKYLVTEQKHVISINVIVVFNEYLRTVLTSIVWLTNVDGLWQEDGFVVILICKKLEINE